MCMCIYIYIYTHTYTHVYTCVSLYYITYVLLLFYVDPYRLSADMIARSAAIGACERGRRWDKAGTYDSITDVYMNIMLHDI